MDPVNCTGHLPIDNLSNSKIKLNESMTTKKSYYGGEKIPVVSFNRLYNLCNFVNYIIIIIIIMCW